MNCSEDVAIASNIAAYRDNGYRNCYIQAGNAIYCEGLATGKFTVMTGEGYRDCDIRAGAVTFCAAWSNATHSPVDIPDDEPRVWMRWLKSSLCRLPSAWKPDDCADKSHLPVKIISL
ncbi:hypothetical protein GWD52_11330 [Enterobacteriaceae bacterium 4M9]|nr:hypothetical protein [Enterobacteriaceae bacterium 4M9]